MPSLFSRSRTTSAVTTSDVDELGRREQPQHLPDGFFPTNLQHKPTTTEYGYLSYKRGTVLSLDNVARLTEVICEELGTRGGITTPFIFSSFALDINPSAIKRLIDRFLESDQSAENQHRWREEARFAGPHELAMVLRWGLARVLRFVKGQGQVHGLVSWDHYMQWRQAEQQLNYPPNYFTSFLSPLPPPLRSIILTTLSLLTRLTAHSKQSGHTPPTLSPLFGPLFFGLHTQNFITTYQSYLRSTHATEHMLLAFIRWQDSPRDGSSLPGVQTALAVPTRLKEWIKDYPAQIPTDLNAPRKSARQLRLLTVKRNVRMYSPDLVKSASSWAYRKPQSSNPPKHSGIEPNGLIGTPEWERISPGGQAPRYGDSYRKRLNMPSTLQPDASYRSSSSVIYGASAPGVGGGTKVDVDIYTATGSGVASFRSLTDLKWGEFESLGFSSPSLLTPTLSSSSSILSLSSSTSTPPTSGSSWFDRDSDTLEKKLQFDLTESARSYSRSSKRQTLSWNDFSSAGFNRNDNPLSTSLSFSPHLTLSPPGADPKERDKEREKEEKKLKKKEKMPIFGWDTTPVLGGEEVVEENFFDIWCDFLWGTWGAPPSTGSSLSYSGSLGAGGAYNTPISRNEEKDLSRDLERECNWALIEYKSLPPNRKKAPANPEAPDPRLSTTVLLFEEFVPLEYRQELAKVYGLLPPQSASPIPNAISPQNRTRLVSLFSSPSSGSSWKPAQTLNGKPYVVGQTPEMSSKVDLVDKETEFEGLLRGSGKKVIKLSSSALTEDPAPASGSRISDPLFLDRSTSAPLPAKAEKQIKIDPTLVKVKSKEKDDTGSPLSKKARFGLKTPKSKREKALPPAGYSSVDFETRFRGASSDSASSSDGSLAPDVSTGDAALDKEREEKRARRMSRKNGEDDDAWVDILVGSQGRRIADQEVEMSASTRRRPNVSVGKSDPDLASKAVAQALANVRRSSSSDSLSLRERRRGQIDPDPDVDEIQTIPRARPTPGRQDQYKADSEFVDSLMEPVDVDFNDYSEDESVEGENAALAALRAARDRRKQAATYFDLHPDRRPVSTATAGSRYSDDEEDGSRLAYDDSDDGHAQYAAHNLPKGAAPPNAPSASPPGSPPAIRPLPTVPQPQAKPMPSNIPVPTNPVPPVRSTIAAASGNGHTGEGKSKTASLIEMYREKEKVSPPPPAKAQPQSTSPLPPLNVPIPPLVPTPAPSRLPVRNAALPTPPIQVQQPKPVPAVPQSPPQEELQPPKPVLAEETGRGSPGLNRYVHGAPLHNVVEEEEED